MPTFNELIVEAFYRVQLDRTPSDNERAHWIGVIEQHGSALFAEHILSSAEAAEVRQKRAQRAANASPEGLEANIARADLYFAELAGELDAAPTSIALTGRASASLPAAQIDRLCACPAVQLVEPSSRSAASIRICDVSELEGSTAPETIVVALVGPPSLEWTLADLRYRVRVSELARLRTLAARLPANMRASGDIDLRASSQRDNRLPCPAIVLEAATDEPAASQRWAAATLARACLHHFLSGQAARCIEALDDWDLVMGTNLAGRYKAFAGLLN